MIDFHLKCRRLLVAVGTLEDVGKELQEEKNQYLVCLKNIKGIHLTAWYIYIVFQGALYSWSHCGFLPLYTWFVPKAFFNGSQQVCNNHVAKEQ